MYTPLYRGFPCQKVCFLLVLTLFFLNTFSTGVYVMSSAASGDRMIGFRMSSDEIRFRSENRNQCNMQKKDGNFLLYENRSIMNTKIRWRWYPMAGVCYDNSLISCVSGREKLLAIARETTYTSSYYRRIQGSHYSCLLRTHVHIAPVKQASKHANEIGPASAENYVRYNGQYL